MALATLIALATLAGSCDGAPHTGRAAASSYAFASELGSGIYEVSGRTVQVYRIPASHALRDASPPDGKSGGEPGLRFVAPITIGFFDFKPEDVFSAGLPKGLDAVTVLPGVEWTFMRSERWRIVPFVRGGYAFASGSDADARLAGLGVRSEYDLHGSIWQIAQQTELRVLHADFRGCLRDDTLARLRNAAEARRGTGRRLRNREIEMGFFGVLDFYADPPREPVGGTPSPRVQAEGGIMLGLRPPPQYRGIELPRIGIGWREAGDLSGWRLVFGRPF